MKIKMRMLLEILSGIGTIAGIIGFVSDLKCDGDLEARVEELESKVNTPENNEDK